MGCPQPSTRSGMPCVPAVFGSKSMSPPPLAPACPVTARSSEAFAVKNGGYCLPPMRGPSPIFRTFTFTSSVPPAGRWNDTVTQPSEVPRELKYAGSSSARTPPP